MLRRLLKLIHTLYERQKHMSAQLDALVAAQAVTTANVAALTTAVAALPKLDDLTAVTAQEKANSDAVAQLMASITPAS